MAVSEVKSKDSYKEFIKSNKLCALHFYAPWADQCKQMNDLLEDLALQSKYANIKFAKIVAEDFPEASLNCQITAVPTIVFFVEEKIVARVDGAKPMEVAEKLDTHLLDKTAENGDKEDLEARLQGLIGQAACVLFMKGNQETPKCGFSRQIVALLDSLNADYETFDILEDNEVREGLKKYSNWPTYPQLYINGELIGGLDIVREMHETGDLEEMLPKKTTGNLEARLKALINKAPCMLFMKGDKLAPRCGFSKSMIAILNEQKADYQTFDILGDNDVREGLKKFSNWPTYPQLYIQGELIGGLDIIKEMLKSGDLDEMLPKLKA